MYCWFTYRTFSSVAAVETFFMYRYQFNLEIIFIGDKKLSLIVVATFFPVFRHLLWQPLLCATGVVVCPLDVPVLEVPHISSAPDLPLLPRHLLLGTPTPPHGGGDDAGPQHEDSGAALSVGGRSVEDQTWVKLHLFVCSVKICFR